MKLIISIIVVIVTAIAYFTTKKYYRRKRALRTYKIKTEILRKISELEVLHAHCLPFYSESIIELMSQGSKVNSDSLRATAKDYEKQVLDIQELRSFLEETNEDSLDLDSLHETLINVNEMIRHSRSLLKSLPPEIRDIMKKSDV